MKFKFALALLLTCLTAGIYAAPKDSDNTFIRLQRYYAEPDSSLIVPALVEIYDKDVVAESNLIGTSVFFARFIEQKQINAEKIYASVKDLKLSDIEQTHLALIFHYAGESSYESKVLDGMKPENATFTKDLFKDFTPIDGLFPELKNTRWTLPVQSPFTWSTAMDCMWSSFFVTGDTKYVNGVILILDKLQTRSSGPKKYIDANITAAIWSLTGNAIAHDKVYEYLKTRVSEADNKDISAQTRTMVGLALVKASAKRTEGK